MRFIDLDKSYIKQNSILTTIDGKDYYIFSLGTPIQVVTTKRNHMNTLLSNNLVSSCISDDLMLRYQPSTNIYFSVDFINNEDDKNLASINIDTKSSSLFIGSINEFELTQGVLTFSGWLSANNYVESDKLIYSSKVILDSIKDKCRVLGLGLRGDKIFGIYYIPSTRGILLGRRNSTRGIAVTTFKEKSLPLDYRGFSIKDWFNGTKIKSLD